MWFELRRENLAFTRTAPVVHVCAAHVAAPRPRVFAAIAEPRGWKDWFPGVREARYGGAPPYGVGSVRQALVGRTRWEEEMIAWEEDACWAYTVTGSSVPLARAQVEVFALEDAGGSTRVRWTLAQEPRLLARLGAPWAPRIIDRLFQRAMANLDEHLRRPR
jgi:carbon monoxide dehydrogenase subunit G